MGMKSLIAVMTSRYATEAPRPDSAKVEIIKEMLDFLNLWGTRADKQQFRSVSIPEVLRMTLTSAIELLNYLKKVVGFSYVLTSSLSREKIENFFSIVRMSSGSMHTQPQQSLPTVNCLSFNNLACCVIGANVHGSYYQFSPQR